MRNLDRRADEAQHLTQMLELGPATEHEMVLAFLKAELGSPRFSRDYQIDLRLIDSADLQSCRENEARLGALQRAKGALVLRDANWQRVALEKGDLPRLKYLNHPHWIELSGGTRLVSEGAKNVGSDKSLSDTKDHILAVADAFRAGKTYPDLIAVTEGKNGADIILTEGHVRATAYARAGWHGTIRCILGTSPTVHEWDARYGARANAPTS